MIKIFFVLLTVGANGPETSYSEVPTMLECMQRVYAMMKIDPRENDFTQVGAGCVARVVPEEREG